MFLMSEVPLYCPCLSNGNRRAASLATSQAGRAASLATSPAGQCFRGALVLKVSNQLSILKQPLYRNVQHFRGGLVIKAHTLLCHKRALELHSLLESSEVEEEVRLDHASWPLSSRS